MNLFDGLPALAPIVAHEATDYGWRGLTALGEVLEVKGSNGHRATIPEDGITVVRDGVRIGRRAVIEHAPGVADYLTHYNRAIASFTANDYAAALDEFDAAIALAPTARAIFNRALVLMGLGRWREGFKDYETRFEFWVPPLCAEVLRHGIKRWHGEDIRGKRLLLVHDAGFGDTIMLLRYVPMLEEMGADVRLLMPPELKRLAEQVAPLAQEIEADFFCPILSLLHALDQTGERVPGGTYLAVDPVLVRRWRSRIKSPRRRIGIAWSVGRLVEGDFPRSIPLGQLVGALSGDADLYSLQMQEDDEAAKLGVRAYSFEDFADCAALASLMDRIVTIDTAAVHVAGAIGHHDVTVLLSHWASWRWRGNPFYPQIRMCQQTSPGYWASALVQL